MRERYSIERDWRELERREDNHRFYVIPKPPKNDIEELVRDMYYLKLETRKTKKGYIVETYAVPILRKDTEDNAFMPGILFLKIIHRPDGTKTVKYNIVKIPLPYQFLLMVDRLIEFNARRRASYLPTIDVEKAVKVIEIREHKLNEKVEEPGPPRNKNLLAFLAH